MEDAVQALKMVFAVFVFVFALSVSFYVLSSARATGEIVFYATDKTNYYDNVKADTSKITRIVGLETVIPTLYRYYRENFAVNIVDSEGVVLQVFDTTTEWEYSNAAKAIVPNERQNALLNLYNKKGDYKCMYGAPWLGTTDEDAKERIDLYIKGEKGYIKDALVDYTKTGLFTCGKITSDTKFEEIFTEYHFSGNYVTEIRDDDDNLEKLEDDERLVDDNQGSTKIIITYKIVK